MTTKTNLYFAILVLALLGLAVGGWTVKGAKTLTRKTPLHPRAA
jgi:hypothetical protein